MMNFLMQGGVVVWIIIAVGLVGLGHGARAVARPTRARLEFLSRLAHAELFATIGGTVAGFAATFHALNTRFADDPKWAFVLMQGLGESLVNSIVGFTFLFLLALLGAVGAGRLREAA